MVSYNTSSRDDACYLYPTVNTIFIGGETMNTASLDKLYIGWDDIERIVDQLTISIEMSRESKPLQKIIGISRGGLIPGVMLSQRLNVPFEPLQWQTRDGNFKDTLQLLSSKYEDQDDILFVDDICDSGLTVQQIRGVVPDSQWAVCYSKKGNLHLDFEGERLYNNTQWLVFPWETE